VLGPDVAYLCTKFDDSSFSCSRDIVGALQNLNGYLTWPRAFQGRYVIHGLALTTINLST